MRKRIRSLGVRTTVVLTLVLSLVAVTAPAQAFVRDATGNVVEISPPASVGLGGICGDTDMQVFDERQGVTLASEMNADFANPGTYTSAPAWASRVRIPAGTVVDSHLLASRKCSAASTVIREGGIEFASDIVGVMATGGKIVDSDILGAPSTSYPGSIRDRQWELSPSADWLRIDSARELFAHASTTTAVDHMRILTRSNEAPTVDAGGPYLGFEGAPVALSGSATDPELDPVTVEWSISWSGDPGVVCTITNENTLTPSVECDDDAIVTATIEATDGYHSPVSDNEQVTISNADPEITSLTLPTMQVGVGAPVNLNALFTDPGANDTHGASSSVSWGDTSTSTPSINQGLGTASATHAYTEAGEYTVTLTIVDDNGGLDTATGTVSVNGIPTADANGPYSGDEGSVINLYGTAADPEDDGLTIGWTFLPGPADAGTTCNYTGVNTLTPTVSCNDDVVVEATLSVDDGINTPVTSVTTVAVGNVAPTVAVPTVTGGPFIVGQSVPVSATFTDPATNDTHTAEITWGDTSSSAATVVETNGSGTASGSHAYTAPGMYVVTVTVTDDNGLSHAQQTIVVINAAPTGDAGGPYVGFEGSDATLNATVNDADGDPLTLQWSITHVSDPGTTCTLTNATTTSPTINCNDDAVVTATLEISDGINPPVEIEAQLTIGNVAPTAGPVTTSPVVMPLGTPITAGINFADVGTNDTHTVSIDWEDGNVTNATVTETNGSGSATGSHTYGDVGLYWISITVTDDNTGAVTVLHDFYVVVYDPNAGHVRSTAHYASPSGAHTPEDSGDPDLTGQAQLGLQVKYNIGDTVPSGHADFRFNTGSITMASTGFAWLVVTDTGTKATFRGTGTVNSVSGYEFVVSVIDGPTDYVRVKVWQTSSGTVIYDTQFGDPDDANAITPTTNGQVVIDV